MTPVFPVMCSTTNKGITLKKTCDIGKEKQTNKHGRETRHPFFLRKTEQMFDWKASGSAGKRPRLI